MAQKTLAGIRKASLLRYRTHAGVQLSGKSRLPCHHLRSIDYLIPKKFPNSTTLLDSSNKRTQNYKLSKVKTEEDEDEDECDLQIIPAVGCDLEMEMEMEMEKRELKAIAEKTLESARAFKSENPFYIVSMKPSYLGPWGLYIPVKFVRKYLSNDELCIDCVLEASSVAENWGPFKCKVGAAAAKLYGKGWVRFRK